MAHIVTAPLVVARDESDRDVYLYAGSPVPSSVPAKEVARLVKGGFIEKVESEAPAPDEK